MEILAEIESSFDANRVRVKQQFRHKLRGAEFSDWIGPTYSILADDIALSRDGSVEHSVFKENQSFYPDIYASKRVFGPQFVGTSSYGVWEMPDHSPRGFLEQSDREAQAVNEDIIDGMKTVRVDYQLRDGSDFTVWFAQNRYGLVRRIKQAARSPSGLFERVTDVELKEWVPETGFPV